jgi:hypothetical protein
VIRGLHPSSIFYLRETLLGFVAEFFIDLGARLGI